MVINVQETRIIPQVGSALSRKPYSSGMNCATPSFGAAPAEAKNLYQKMENHTVNFFLKMFPKQKNVEDNSLLGKTIKAAGDFNMIHNRLFIGAFALLTQPWIDLFNPNVDDETKKMSCIRTAAKVIIGTATGVAVRHVCINMLAPKYTKVGKELEKEPNKKMATLFMPENKTALKKLAESENLLAEHRNVIGNLAAIAVMMITDPPLTIFLTNFFKKYLTPHKQTEMKPNIVTENAVNKEVNNG